MKTNENVAPENDHTYIYIVCMYVCMHACMYSGCPMQAPLLASEYGFQFMVVWLLQAFQRLPICVLISFLLEREKAKSRDITPFSFSFTGSKTSKQKILTKGAITSIDLKQSSPKKPNQVTVTMPKWRTPMNKSTTALAKLPTTFLLLVSIQISVFFFLHFFCLSEQM